MPVNAVRHVRQQQRIAARACSGPASEWFRVSSDDSRSPSHPVVSISSVAVFVTGVFLRNRIVTPVSNLQPGGPVDLIY